MKYVAAILLLVGIIITDRAAVAANTLLGDNNQNANRMLEAESLLSQLGYWVVSIDGKSDASTKHAVTAFQKVEGLKRTGVLDNATLERMRSAQRPIAKYVDVAHVEIDISRQVLFMVDDNGVVTHVLPVSTGNNQKYFSEGKWEKAYTPRGRLKVQRQIKGVRKAPLGTKY